MHVCACFSGGEAARVHSCGVRWAQEASVGKPRKKKGDSGVFSTDMLCQVAVVRVLSVVDKQRSQRRRREVQGAVGGHMGATWTSGWILGGGWSQNDDRDMS